MSERTIVQVDPGFDDESFAIRLRRSPVNVLGGAKPCRLDLPPGLLPSWASENAVRKYGEKLYEALCQSHLGISQSFQACLAAQALA